MLQFLAGFTLGNVVGMYLAQNYEVLRGTTSAADYTPLPTEWSRDEALWSLTPNYIDKVPNISKKIEAFKKDVEAKKKPPEE